MAVLGKRVIHPGGRHSTDELVARATCSRGAPNFLGEVCPGMNFDTLEDWVQIYRAAGLDEVQVTSGPFEMMTPAGFLRDEGFMNCLIFMGRTLSRLAYMKKMAWLMPRMQRAVPYLGYIVVAGTKPV
jgi:hypothetical protein